MSAIQIDLEPHKAIGRSFRYSLTHRYSPITIQPRRETYSLRCFENRASKFRLLSFLISSNSTMAYLGLLVILPPMNFRSRSEPFMSRIKILLVVALLIFSSAIVAEAKHRLVTQGNGKLAIVGADGKIEWEMNWGGIHDLHVLANGNIMVQERMRKIVEIDVKTKKVVWSYDASTQNGNAGKRIEVHAFQPLKNGNVMIAESGIGRIIEINRNGEIQKEVKLKVDHPHPHRDTRLARQIKNGNYLVCHEGDGVVREYDGKSGKVIWEFPVPLFDKPRKGGHGPEAHGNQTFGAVRLESGNTLIATGNGHSVLEVTPKNEIVWQLHQNDLPNITLAWVTTLEVLPNGNYVIGNCHAGPKNPLLIEIEPKSKKVIWTFDQFEKFGNSVPNSQLLDVGESIR